MLALIFILFVTSYLLGSIPFGLLLTKVFVGVDLREIGSKNIGTTNVLRTGSKTLALVTLLLDMGKGALGASLSFIFLAYMHNSPELQPLSLPNLGLTVGIGAMLGHCFPIWLKFKGGKGVATGCGVLLATVPLAGLVTLTTWLVVMFTTRYSSLAALCACAIAPIVTFFIYGATPAVICLLITIFVFIRHKENIKRLLAGTESKIGRSKG